MKNLFKKYQFFLWLIFGCILVIAGTTQLDNLVVAGLTVNGNMNLQGGNTFTVNNTLLLTNNAGASQYAAISNSMIYPVAGIPTTVGAVTNFAVDCSVPVRSFTQAADMNWLYATNLPFGSSYQECLYKIKGAGHVMWFTNAGATCYGPWTSNTVTLGASNGFWLLAIGVDTSTAGATNLSFSLVPPNK